jgi:hypothetical protein
MILIDAEAITGCSVGFELVTGEDLFEDNQSYYLVLDLFILRFVFTWMKGS